MDALSLWMMIGGIASACVVSTLYVVAAVFRDEQRVRDLQDTVVRLRDDYQRRLRAMESGDEPMFVFPVESGTDTVTPPTPATTQRRAA